MHQLKEKRWMRHLMNPTWAEDDVKSWHSKSTQRAEHTAMSDPLSLTNPSLRGKRSNPRFPVLAHSPPASATEPSFTSLRNAPEWLSLWSQINPSLQLEGLNSIWRTVHRGEWGEEEWNW